MLRAPANTVEVISGNSLKHCEALASCGIPAADRTYVEAWKTADERCWTHVQEHLGSDGEELSEAVAIDTIFRELEEDTQLTIGNSLPIRGVDAVVPGHRARLRILHQRGTSGIEGLIAGALGSSAKTPSALLMGDVSCAHDLSSLAMHREALGPLLIIVVDNGGGKIFSHLPVAAIGMPAKHWAFWESPPQVDFSLVCRGYGVAHRLCESQASLADSLRWAQRRDGTTMLQVKVAPDSMRVFLSSSRDTLA